MATVLIETGPQWFICASSTGVPFKADDAVTFTPPAGGAVALEGRITETKTANFGNPATPTLQLGIAVTSGDLSLFQKEGVFASYKIKGKGSTSEAVVHAACKTKYSAQLFKASELQQMFDKAVTLIKAATDGHDDAFAKKWFGTIATSKGTELAKIHQRCGELNSGVEGLAIAVFEVVGGEFLGGIDPKAKGKLKGGGTCRIQLGKGFAYTRYSWGEKVATIVHELTHWILGTVDAKYGNEDAYGVKCIEMTRDAKECSKALNNADNWSFYICEYRGADVANDWRFFTEPELKGRCPFSQDPKNTDMLLIA